mmetsp:Transcript_16383/g.21258  ORF Transcript_16383/g.21258 Transcript_16383/m.21258 type:complete len:168 (+) Transcript_16383:191-694(+)
MIKDIARSMSVERFNVSVTNNDEQTSSQNQESSPSSSSQNFNRAQNNNLSLKESLNSNSSNISALSYDMANRCYDSEHVKMMNLLFPSSHSKPSHSKQSKLFQLLQLFNFIISQVLSVKSIWSWMLVSTICTMLCFSVYGMMDVFCLYKYGIHVSDVLLFMKASCMV